MAMAPKKKYDYYDHGRGIAYLVDCSEGSDSPHQTPQQQQPQSSFHGDYNVPSANPNLSPSSSSFQGPSSPLDFSSNTMSPSLSCSPSLDYSTPYQGYHGGYASGDPYTSDISSEPSTSNRGGSHEPFITTDTYEESYSRMEGKEGDSQRFTNTKSQKRQQKCRMCLNHNKQVDMKGHKWYCPYRECTCDACDITRKNQFFSKERQKLTRQQQQQKKDERNQGIRGTAAEISTGMDSDICQVQFPRMQEMVSQTEDILDYTLFAQVNKACNRGHISRNE